MLLSAGLTLTPARCWSWCDLCVFIHVNIACLVVLPWSLSPQAQFSIATPLVLVSDSYPGLASSHCRQQDVTSSGQQRTLMVWVSRSCFLKFILGGHQRWGFPLEVHLRVQVKVWTHREVWFQKVRQGLLGFNIGGWVGVGGRLPGSSDLWPRGEMSSPL